MNVWMEWMNCKQFFNEFFFFIITTEVIRNDVIWFNNFNRFSEQGANQQNLIAKGDMIEPKQYVNNVLFGDQK